MNDHGSLGSPGAKSRGDQGMRTMALSQTHYSSEG